MTFYDAGCSGFVRVAMSSFSLLAAFTTTMPASVHAFHDAEYMITNGKSDPPHVWATQSHLFSSLRTCGIVVIAVIFVWSALSRKANAAVIISCWMLAGMTMNLVNKEIAVTFKATALIVVLQMLFSAAAFMLVEWKELRYGRVSDLAKWLVVPFFFTGMLMTSMWSFKELSLSAVLILRNLLPIFTFAAEKLLFDEPNRISTTMLMSMCIALVGTVVYGHCSIAVSARGIIFIGMNCVITVMDRLLQRHLLKSPDFSVSLPLCMVLNNVVGIFLTIGIALASGEVFMWHSVVRQATPSSWSLIFFSCICGCCLGYLGLRCQKLVSATTFLVLQNFSKVLLLFLSMDLFGDQIKGVSALGCLLSMFGALGYGYERLPQETSKDCSGMDNKKLEAEKMLKLKKGYGTP